MMTDALRDSTRLASEGMRVLQLARSATLGAAGEVPKDAEAVALVVLADDIRPDAADTIDYFGREHVRVRVISGDNPRTVAAIAARCGVPGSDRWVDARSLPDDPDERDAATADVAVFGRVTPRRQALARARGPAARRGGGDDRRRGQRHAWR